MFPTPLTIGSLAFERQREGQYINTASTIDTPDLWIIQNKNLFPNNGNEAIITLKTSVSKNSSSLTQVADAVFEAWQTLKFVPGQFTQAEVETIMARFPSFLTTSNLTRLFRAET